MRSCVNVVYTTYIYLSTKKRLSPIKGRRESKMKKSRKETQIEAVKAILSGELLLEEAMKKYDVRDKRTILSWMKTISPLIQHSAFGANTIKEVAEPNANVHEYVITENSLLRKVVGLQEQLRELEKENAQIVAQRNLLIDKVTRLEHQLQTQDD